MTTELCGIDHLKKKLSVKKIRASLRYGFYEMKNITRDISNVMPAQFAWYRGCLGWCAKAVDSLADRLVFRDFKNDYFNLNDIFAMNN